MTNNNNRIIKTVIPNEVDGLTASGKSVFIDASYFNNTNMVFTCNAYSPLWIG
jgi:hypothetical protein